MSHPGTFRKHPSRALDHLTRQPVQDDPVSLGRKAPRHSTLETYEWVPAPEVDLVPRVPEDALETVVFLYPAREAAEQGRKVGASGFMVAQPFIHGFGLHMYTVTNRHCVEGRGTTTIRAMTKTDAGSVPVFVDAKECDWIFHDDYDVAIYRWEDGAPEVAAHSSTSLLRRDEMAHLKIGPGEDVYIIARFIHHDGGQRNLPIVHTGMVGMLPLEPIKNPYTDKDEYDFLVETHSRGGYSGSPVNLYILPNQVDLGIRRNVGPQILVLGVMWGHINTIHYVTDPKIKGKNKRTGHVVKLDTMVAGVVPAWEIMDLINGERALTERMDSERKIREDRIAAAEALGPT